MNLIAKLDASLGVTRPLWLWVGQVALVILGAHQAADRLDDDLGLWLTHVPWAWPDPQTPFTVGAWIALSMEVGVAVWAVLSLARTMEHRIDHPREWARRLSVHNVVGPLVWAPIALAGSWAIAMAIEDALPASELATWTSWAIGAVIAWRLGWTGMSRLVVAAPTPKHRWDGWIWAPPLLVVGTYALLHALPIWPVVDALGLR